MKAGDRTRLLRVSDPRSIDELIEVALQDREHSYEMTEGTRALVALQERGTHAVLLCHAADPGRRVLGARILGELRASDAPSGVRAFPEECCDALLDLVRNDQDRRVLVAAIFALGHLGNQRCEPDLVSLRNHPDEDVRHGVAFTLCGSTSGASVAALLELMDDPYETARDWATTSIGMTVSLDGPEIRAALLRRATDEDEITRGEALHGLARRHDTRVVPYLIAALSSETERMSLFIEAAQTYLGIDAAEELDVETLLSKLRS
jgi:HEAT repeat protein